MMTAERVIDGRRIVIHFRIPYGDVRPTIYQVLDAEASAVLLLHPSARGPAVDVGGQLRPILPLLMEGEPPNQSRPSP